MREIIKYLKEHLKSDFSIGTYVYSFLFITCCIVVNYTFDFEDSVLNTQEDKALTIVYYILFYAFAYFGIAIPLACFKKDYTYLKNKWFWIKAGLFIGLIGIDGGFFYIDDWISGITDSEDRRFLRKLFTNSYSFILYLIPVYIMKVLKDNEENGVYGLSLQKFDARPYLYMLLIMLPLIAWASFQEDFLDTYPQMKPWKYHEAWGLRDWQLIAIFEPLYALDFVAVEFIFRGALIIGLFQIMGKSVLLPMVSTYAFLHFGKPVAETIGSVFGGYILGVIAMNTRSIFGGCLIHIGVAWMMELMAFLQYHFKD